MISIIIRTKNEERWIAQCLRRVLNQSVDDIEVVLVDNRSTDKTVDRALQVCPDLTVVSIDEYRPGFAINEGIRAAQGEFLAVLSAHCLPLDDAWLEKLLGNVQSGSVAGVYGRQIPTRFSTAADKRDLLVSFGLDRRVQQRDTFFHNANSMFRRDVWERFPFDENVTNIEDRVWAKAVIDAGYTLVYEPDAAVYHHHGIHQNNSRERCDQVVQIMEKLDLQPQHERQNPLNPDELEVAAIVPIREDPISTVDAGELLIQASLNAARSSKYVKRVIVATDSRRIAQTAVQSGAEVPFLRPKEMSSETVRVDQVLQYTLGRLEADGYFPDLIVPLELTHPFRPDGLIDDLIVKLVDEGLDTVIAGFREYRPCWVHKSDGFVRLDDRSQIRHARKPMHVGLPSLGCVTYPEFIRRGTRLGERIGIFEIGNPLPTIEIRDREGVELLNSMRHLLPTLVPADRRAA